MANRKAAEAVILTYIEKLLPGSENTQIYKDLFASMDDKAFDAFMVKLEQGDIRLAIIAPNLSDKKLTIERNFQIAEELGHNFFERIWIDRGDDVPPYLSTIPYLVVDLPLRRQAQLLEKKISIPEDNHSIDQYTGQPTGKSKGSKISYPETQVLMSLNLEESLTEKLKFRGGDIKGFNAMNTAISRTGGVSLKSIEHLGTKVKSTETLSVFLTSMHLSNTL
jgi:hypothetical protein